MTNIVDMKSFLNKRNEERQNEIVTALDSVSLPAELAMIMSLHHQLDVIIGTANSQFPQDIKMGETIRLLHIVRDIFTKVSVPFDLPIGIFCQESKHYDQKQVENTDRLVRVDLFNVNPAEIGDKPESEISFQLRISNYFDDFKNGTNIDVSEIDFDKNQSRNGLVKCLIQNSVDISRNSGGVSFLSSDLNILMIFIPCGGKSQINIAITKRCGFSFE